MVMRRFLGNPGALMALSAILSLAAVGLHCLGLSISSVSGDRLMDLCIFWAMSIGAFLCATRALRILHRRTKDGLPQPLLGLVPAVFLMGLGLLLTLAETFILYLHVAMPNK